MSTRSNAASAFNADNIVEAERQSWAQLHGAGRDQLHSAGMGMFQWTHSRLNDGVTNTDLASTLGVSHVTAPSEEAMRLHERNCEWGDNS